MVGTTAFCVGPDCLFQPRVQVRAIAWTVRPVNLSFSGDIKLYRAIIAACLDVKPSKSGFHVTAPFTLPSVVRRGGVFVLPNGICSVPANNISFDRCHLMGHSYRKKYSQSEFGTLMDPVTFDEIPRQERRPCRIECEADRWSALP